MDFIKLQIKDPKHVKSVKLFLESNDQLNKSRKIEANLGNFTVYTTLTTIDSEYLQQFDFEYYSLSPNSSTRSLKSIIQEDLSGICDEETILLLNIPKKWSIYPPLVLFPMNSFTGDNWNRVFEQVDKSKFFNNILQYVSLQSATQLTHVAINQPIIESDVMRRPFNITPVYGDFGPDSLSEMWEHPTENNLKKAFWCSVVQNGIYQTWAPKYTMFSRGNIKEKARVLKFNDIKSNTVIDMYCGIGYFSLSYLKAGCGELFGWELNPWSIEGFIRALKQNKFYTYVKFSRNDNFNYSIYQQLRKSGVNIFLFEENNEHITERFSTFPMHSMKISHVNLGLLPSSQGSWDVTKEVLTKYNGFPTSTVHIHENVHVDDFQKFEVEAKQLFLQNNNALVVIKHLEKVKTFAPNVWHIVVDLQMIYK
jgi:tRNA wybutosine-synthesizing protein 2